MSVLQQVATVLIAGAATVLTRFLGFIGEFPLAHDVVDGRVGMGMDADGLPKAVGNISLPYPAKSGLSITSVTFVSACIIFYRLLPVHFPRPPEQPVISHIPILFYSFPLREKKARLPAGKSAPAGRSRLSLCTFYLFYIHSIRMS